MALLWTEALIETFRVHCFYEKKITKFLRHLKFLSLLFIVIVTSEVYECFSQKQLIQRENSRKYFNLQTLCRRRYYFLICKFCHF